MIIDYVRHFEYQHDPASARQKSTTNDITNSDFARLLTAAGESGELSTAITQVVAGASSTSVPIARASGGPSFVPQSTEVETTTASAVSREAGTAATVAQVSEKTSTPASGNDTMQTASATQSTGSEGAAYYDQWFQTIQCGQPGEAGSYAWYPWFSANSQGAAEALRLVQQYVPDAHIQSFVYPGQLDGQPASHAVVLPNGNELNAGLLLYWYYHQGTGADGWSDSFLRTSLTTLGADLSATSSASV